MLCRRAQSRKTAFGGIQSRRRDSHVEHDLGQLRWRNHMAGGLSAGNVDNITVTSSTISGNSRGGINATNYVAGNVAVTSSTISGNTYEGGLSLGVRSASARSRGTQGSVAAGFMSWIGDVTVTSSTISGNSGGRVGGIFAMGDVTVTSSTISGNSAGYDGGGIYARGNVTVTSSTISGNSAEFGTAAAFMPLATLRSASARSREHRGTAAAAFMLSRRHGHLQHDLGELGLDSAAAAFYASGDVTVTSSTISGNSAI